MIDVENMIFDHVSKYMAEAIPSANVTNAFVEEEAVFPCLTVKQKNSVPVRKTNTVDSSENYTTVTIEITAYTSGKDVSQSECQKLLNEADNAMKEIGFRRIHISETFNISRTLSRRYSRYEGVVRAPIEIDGNTVYEVYRRW